MTGKNLLTLEGHSDYVRSVAISNDNTKVVTGSDDKTAKVWDIRTGKNLLTLEGHSGDVTSVAISNDNTKIVTGSSDKTAKLWDSQTYKLLNTINYNHRVYKIKILSLNE